MELGTIEDDTCELRLGAHLFTEAQGRRFMCRWRGEQGSLLRERKACMPSVQESHVPAWVTVNRPSWMPALSVIGGRREDTVDINVAEEDFAEPGQAMKTFRYRAVGFEAHQVAAGSPMALVGTCSILHLCVYAIAARIEFPKCQRLVSTSMRFECYGLQQVCLYKQYASINWPTS